MNFVKSILEHDNTVFATNDNIMSVYQHRCLLCNKVAHTVHEIVPRSQLPKLWDVAYNRVPVCNVCHTKIHDKGAKHYKQTLISKQELRLHRLYDSKLTI